MKNPADRRARPSRRQQPGFALCLLGGYAFLAAATRPAAAAAPAAEAATPEAHRPAAASPSIKPPPRPPLSADDLAASGPGRVLRRFDSLMERGAYAPAKELCRGEALRLFDLLRLAQERLAPFIDTAASRETYLEMREAGPSAYVKVRSVTVFRKKVMGLDSLESVQALHFSRLPVPAAPASPPVPPPSPIAPPASGSTAPASPTAPPAPPSSPPVPTAQGSAPSFAWFLSGFEELSHAEAAVKLRPAPATVTASVDFPRSRLAPAQRGAATLFRCRIRPRSASAPLPVADARQTLRPIPSSRAAEGGGFDLLARSGTLPRRSASLQGPDHPPTNDSLRAFLASGTYVDLLDSLLVSLARETVQGATTEEEAARRLYGLVRRTLRFKLGATLFGTSREVLRRREGDCSEAAVLVVALLRAVGLPARVVLGLAGEENGRFIGHAWAEVYLREGGAEGSAPSPRGAWTGLDPALGGFPADAFRIKFLALRDDADYRVQATNLMLGLLGNFEVETQELRSGKGPIPLRRVGPQEAKTPSFFEEALKGAAGDP